MLFKVICKTYCWWHSHRDVSFSSTATERNSEIIPSKRSHFSIFRKMSFEQFVNFPPEQDIASSVRSIIPCWRYLSVGLNWLDVDLRLSSTYFNAVLTFPVFFCDTRWPLDDLERFKYIALSVWLNILPYLCD